MPGIALPSENKIAIPFPNLSFQEEDRKTWYISAKDEELNLRFMPWTITVFVVDMDHIARERPEESLN